MTSQPLGEHEPDRASPAPKTSDDAATTPISPESTLATAPHPSIDSSGSAAAHGPVAEPHPVAPNTAPARSALIAGAAGLAIVAGALGFGAGYITGDNTTPERPSPAAVWQQGGNGPGMGGGTQMGGPQMGGPGMGGLPGRQNQDGESGSEPDDQNGPNTSPGTPTEQQGQADTGA
ncbi:hypothetical protein [Gordonia sp. NPDC127522]|uniref:hypothetical protein n=1 Tax=Gordonia sp. NPDC127522 TaxID=3345390 RepID=UPI00363655BB